MKKNRAHYELNLGGDCISSHAVDNTINLRSYVRPAVLDLRTGVSCSF